MNENNYLGKVMDLIEKLYTNVTEAWGVPLGNDKCIVDREAMLETINEIKEALPAEIAEAKRLVSTRDEFVGNAKREAESIRKNAEEKAGKLLEEQEIVKKARATRDELISNAEFTSKELRRVANEYVDNLLNGAEEAVATALQSINGTRVKFRNVVDNSASEKEEAEAPAEPAPEAE